MNDEQRLLQAAREAIRAGQKAEARAMLRRVLEQNPQSFHAWLWLAGLSPSPEASFTYIERAQALRPSDPRVAKARAWAQKRLASRQQKKSQPPVAGPDQSLQPAEESAGSRDDVVEAFRARAAEAATEAEDEPRRRWPYLLAGLASILVLLAAIAFWGDAIAGSIFGNTAAETDAGTGDRAFETSGATHPPREERQRLLVGRFEPSQSSAPANSEPSPSATPTAQALAAKVVSKSNNDPRPTWTLTPTPTNTPSPTPTPVPTFVSNNDAPAPVVLRPAGVGPDERWIDVNLTTQTLVAYEGNTPVFDSLVSSGTWQYPTVTGQFRIWLRYTAQTMDGRRLGYDYYLPNVPYVMYFYQDYALHGTYWHNNFGTPMSHGCVNLPTPAAEWIFNWSSMGTLVNVHY